MTDESRQSELGGDVVRAFLPTLGLVVVIALAGCGEAESVETTQRATQAAPQQARKTATPAGVPQAKSSIGELQIEDLVVGQGVEARTGEMVDVHYTGWLFDPQAVGNRGKKFDSSHDRGRPLNFEIGAGRVIRGWDVGVAGMKVGGKRVLTIPADMAYGARGAAGGLIPPHADLVFEVDLVRVR